jgi:hypothetical protein
MQPLCRLLLILALAVSPAAHAGGSAVAWIALGGPPARDACTVVAGVRHCPSAQPR